MKNRKRCITVAVSTVLFGIISKWLTGIPYMTWGTFNLHFILAFLLWTLYLSALYVAGKLEFTGQKQITKTVFSGVLFGSIGSCIKMGMDAVIIQITGSAENQVLFLFAMELGVLLFGSGTILFLFYFLQKGSFRWHRAFNRYAGVLGGTIGIYGMLFFWFYSEYQALALCTKLPSSGAGGAVSLDMMLGMERAIRCSQRFTTISTIVCVIVFITLWGMLQKGNIDRKS